MRLCVIVCMCVCVRVRVRVFARVHHAAARHEVRPSLPLA